jgi:hypothetical protein|tara:strand:+ start:4580 stop:4978 length:399 start_codon:yes stop_codon:yes gene_type:complete
MVRKASSLASGAEAYTAVEIASVYSHTIKLVRNDTLPQLSITLTNKTDSTPIDLTNVATIAMKIRPLGGSVVKVSIPMYRTAPYIDGNAFMEFPDGALDTSGTFTGEVEITYTSGAIQTVFDEVKFEVRKDY